MEAMITWPAPASEEASPDYKVTVNGRPVFVYQARVRSQILEHPGLWTHKPGCPAERASFAIFDMAASVPVEIQPGREFKKATVIPARAGVTPEIAGGKIRFRMGKPSHLTVLLDGSDEKPLHLFIGEPEKDVPKPDDPNVVYFGPGVHETHGIKVKSGQTIYLAGGAVVKARLSPDDKPKHSDKWNVDFYNGAALSIDGVKDVRVAGRGILDGSLIPHPGWNLIPIRNSQNVRIEGVMLRDSPNWNFVIQQSEDVTVDDVRIISGRLNSDGINSVNSRRVNIRRCFVRNHDDSIVAKATAPDHPCEDIRVEDCQLWDDWGYAIGVSYETRSPIRRVSFERCDVLFARHWCMGVYLSDSATVSDITFRDIGVADLSSYVRHGGAYAALSAKPLLMRMGIVGDVWGTDKERGRIRNIVVDNVIVDGAVLPASDLAGFDADHTVDGVTFRHIRLRSQPPVADAKAMGLTTNAFVSGVSIEP